MDRLLDYVCDELKHLERKVDNDGKLTSSEIMYADTLAHLKKNLLKAEEYGMSYNSYDDMSYERTRGMSNARKRDSRGRYSRGYSMDNEEMVMKLKEMQNGATDEQRQIINRWIKQVEE